MPFSSGVQDNAMQNGFLLDMSSIIYAKDYHSDDSHYAILIVWQFSSCRKKGATGSLLLSGK